MREIAQELVGAPEEVREELPGFDSAAAVAARQVLEARSAAEEELMLRVPLSKLETKKLKAQRRYVGFVVFRRGLFSCGYLTTSGSALQ